AHALELSELSPREVAVSFTDREQTFISEANVYRLLKAEGLITSPAFIVMKTADRFASPTTAINQLWQTHFTYLRATGWGWYSLSTVLDDFSRYNSAPPWPPPMSPPPSTAHCRLRAWINCPLTSGRACSATTGHPTLPAILPNGSMNTACATRAESPTT